MNKTRFTGSFELEAARIAARQAEMDELIAEDANRFTRLDAKGHYTAARLQHLGERASTESLAYAELTEAGLEVKK